MDSNSKDEISRRVFIGASAIAAGIPLATAQAQTPVAGLPLTRCSLRINGGNRELEIEPRTTLLDLLREQLHMVGTKKGCDHGQCGACTVLIDGERSLSCLTLAVVCEGSSVTTIEGLAQNGQLHPMQAAFLHNDGFQCGFCTPGQICSAVAMLNEVKRGMPSVVSNGKDPVKLTPEEIRERMAGNIYRCGAYPNIVAAIMSVDQGAHA